MAWPLLLPSTKNGVPAGHHGLDCSGLRSCCCSCQLPDQTKRPRYERRAASPDADSPGDQPELHRDLWAEWAAIAGTTARLAVHGVPILPLSLFPVPQCESQFGSLLCMVMAASNSFRTAASIQAAEAAPFLVDYPPGLFPHAKQRHCSGDHIQDRSLFGLSALEP